MMGKCFLMSHFKLLDLIILQVESSPHNMNGGCFRNGCLYNDLLTFWRFKYSFSLGITV